MKALTDDEFIRTPSSSQIPGEDRPAPVVSLARRPRRKRKLSLALQGGGSFGAFTWGVLDRLLEDDTIVIDAVSGASAGAVNAIMLASGLAAGGPLEAKTRLHRFWRRASEAAPASETVMAVNAAARMLSPYQFNPFNLNPLRNILQEEVDFEALRAKPSVRMLIAATRVCDGRLRIFREKEVSPEVILASACLPLVHHAVRIDGEAFWDGGYSANPPLLPLVTASRATEVLIVQIMPTVGAEMPTTASEIVKRAEQITFSAPLAREMESLASMIKLASSEDPDARMARKLRQLRLHHMAAEKEVPSLGEASALNLDWDFLTSLRDAGRTAAERWLGASG